MIKEIKLGNARALIHEGTSGHCYVQYPGMGENDDGGPISLLYKHGPLHFIHDYGWNPNDTHVGIFDDANFPHPDAVEHSLTDLLTLYPTINPKQVYALGLSAGAVTWFKYLLTKSQYTDRIAGAVLMSTPSCNKLYNTNKALITHKPIWVFHGDHDGTCPLDNVKDMYADLKANNPKHFFATILNQAHGPWNPRFDPKYGGPLSGLNIYKWLKSNNPVK